MTLVSTYLQRACGLLRRWSPRATPRPPAPLAELLESRIFLNVAPPVAAVAAALDAAPAVDVSQQVVQIDQPTSSADTSDNTTAFRFAEAAADTAPAGLSADPSSRREVVFVDSAAEDYRSILDDLAAQTSSGRELDVYVLDPTRDGVEQISKILAEYSNLDAIHLVSHGTAGQVKLGATWLNSENLNGYAADLASWNSALSADGDLLIYGCEVAANDAGQMLVESLAALTGADVAAGTNLTGSKDFNGDWEFEYQTGGIETGLAFSAIFQADWHGLLGVITVDTTYDSLDGNTSSIAALLANRGADGLISLREAVLAANNTAGADTIFLPAGVFALTIGGQNENAAATGDLDLSDSLTITGAGSGLSVIDANGLDRVLHVQAGATVTISDVTLRGGTLASSDWGAGLLIDNGAAATLSRVVVTGNSGGSGGGVYNYGTLTATDTKFSNNIAADWGGGLYNDRGNVTLARATISGNTAGKDGAGINNSGSGAVLSLTNVTFSGNAAVGQGGGLWTSRAVTAVNVTIAFNSASSGAGVHGQGGSGIVTFKNSILDNPLGANANKTMASLGFNLDRDGTAGLSQLTDVSGVDSLLAPTLQDNGGFVATHRLLPGSQAIDGGTGSGAPTTDARNLARDSVPDLGAYEVSGMLDSTAELRANTTTTGAQQTISEVRGSPHAVAFADDGSYVVVWSDNGQDGDGWGVFGQRFDTAGTKVGSEFQINETSVGDQHYASIAMNGRGEFVVTWTVVQGGSGNGVYARRFGATGTPLGNEFLVNATTLNDQDSSMVAIGADGRFVIVWEGNGSGDTDGIFGQWYDATGAALGSEVRINSATGGLQGEPSVAMTPDGKTVVVWDDPNGVQAQRFDANRNSLGGTINVNPMNSAGEADVALAADGGFAVVYRATVLDKGIYFQRYDAAGNSVGFAQLVNETLNGDQTNSSIAMNDSGEFLIVWEGIGRLPGDSDTAGVFGRKYNASGNAVSGEVLINQTTTGTQQMASAALLDAANYVVVWSGNGPGDADGVFVRQFGNANTAPVAAADSFSVAEDGTLTVSAAGLLVNDADADSDPLTAVLASGPANAAAFTLNANGSFTYQPSTNFNGSESFTYRANDGTANSGLGTVTVAVTPVNDQPVRTAGAVNNLTVLEDSGLTSLGLGGLAYSPGGGGDEVAQTLTYHATVVPAATLGSVVLADGVTVVTANTNYSLAQLRGLQFRTASNANGGPAAFTWTVQDNGGTANGGVNTRTESLTIAVTPVNDQPVRTAGAVNNLTVLEDSGLTSLGLGGLAYGPGGGGDEATQTLTYRATVVPAATLGSVVLADGVTVVTANTNYSLAQLRGLQFRTASNANGGPAAFTWTVQDNGGTANGGVDTRTESLTIIVAAVNDAPTITSNGGGPAAAILIAENTSAVTTVTAVDVDVPAQVLAFTLGGVDAARFTIDSATGRLEFVIPPDFESPTDAGGSNVYHVTVQVGDGTLVAMQAIAVTVTPVNDNLPSITSNGGGATAAVSITENTTAFTTVTAVDADQPVQNLVYSLAGGADAARFTLNYSSGVLRFAVPPNFEAPADTDGDNIYEVVVGASEGTFTANQTLFVTVVNVNENPVVPARSFTANGDTPLVVNAPGLLAGVADQDGDVLTVTLVGGPTHGSLVLQADGSFVYQASDVYSGPDQFSYQVNDGHGGSVNAVVQIAVQPDVAPLPLPIDSGPPQAARERDASRGENATNSAPLLAPPPTAIVAGFEPASRRTSEGRSPEIAHSAPTGIAAEGDKGALEPSHFDAQGALVARRVMRGASVVASPGLDDPLLVAYDVGLLWNDLTSLKDEMQSGANVPYVAAGTVMGLSGGLTVGYVFWAVRSGWLVTSLLAQMPAWRLVDPLVVLDYLDDDTGGGRKDEDDSLESLLDGDDTQEDDQSEDSASAPKHPGDLSPAAEDSIVESPALRG